MWRVWSVECGVLWGVWCVEESCCSCSLSPAMTAMILSEANSLACFSPYSGSHLQVAVLFCRASKAALTWANQLPKVTESSGKALSIMVCPRELVKAVREDWWPNISDCTLCVCVYVKESMYMYVCSL